MIGQLETAAPKRHFRTYYFTQLLIKQICINAAPGPQKMTRTRSIVQTYHNDVVYPYSAKVPTPESYHYALLYSNRVIM
jgi:hypothetical protein